MTEGTRRDVQLNAAMPNVPATACVHMFARQLLQGAQIV